ncbi:MAG TPA: type II toxin-antitoxin system HicA family toxin [Gemmataceae bacterium]
MLLPALNALYAVGMKVRDVLKLLKANGWHQVSARGGHRQFKHPTKRGRVTLSGKLSHDIPPGTLNSIFKQAGLQS